jgi:HAD superfamily phosphoserine phosphatase-like hydrolase
MQLAIYDMDKTITRRASWMAWLFFFARTEAPLRLLLAPLMALPALGYALGALDRGGLKQATQRILMGSRVPRATVVRAADAFAAGFGTANELPGALAAIAADRAAGREVMLASASCRYFVDALARRWGIAHVVATENIWEGDRLTPAIAGENCYEMGKLRMILAALPERPARVKFVSDHPSDLPVLYWADEPVAANPPPTLRQAALSRGWPVFDWA